MKLALATLFVLLYYNYGKRLMIALAENLVQKKVVYGKIAIQELTGVTELILIVLSHILFTISLACFLHIIPPFSFDLVLAGAFLGAGQMATSSTICFLIVRVLQTLGKNHFSQSRESWAMQAKSGWLRHHFHTLKHLPLPLAITIICLQITCEETVFRGLLFPLSPWLATFLFVFIQGFLMPNTISKMFPIVGALVIGISNAILFTHIPNLTPLIVAHATFFFLSIL